MPEVCISTYVYRICSFDVFPTAVIACWSFTCVLIGLWSLLTHQQLFTQNRRDVKCFLLETVPLIRCLLLQHDMDVLLTGPFVGILKMVGCHALPIPANRTLAVSPPAGKLNCSSHMSDKMGGGRILYLLLIYKATNICQHFSRLLFQGWVWGTCSMCFLMRASLFCSPMNVRYADTWSGQRGLSLPM